MNADLTGVVQAISDARAEILSQLGDVKAEVSELKGTMTANISAVKGTHDTFREELLGVGGRIVELEEGQKTANRRQWVHSVLVVPLLGLFHGLANHFGWKV